MENGQTSGIEDTVAKTDLFAGVAADLLRNIGLSAEHILLNEAENLNFKSPQFFHIVVSGTLSLLRPSAPGTKIVLTKNDVIASDPISAAFVEPVILAAQPVELLRILWAALDLPDLTDLRARIRSKAASPFLLLHLASMPLFRGLPEDEISRIAAHSEMVAAQRGDILIEEGLPAHHLYVIVYGSLEVYRAHAEGPAPIDVLGDGDSVGEMAVLLGEVRSASVRARRDSLLVRVSGNCFEQLLERDPALTLRLARTLGQRLKHTTASPTRSIPLKTIALFPACEGAVFNTFCQRLAEEFTNKGYRTALLQASGEKERRHLGWLRGEEDLYDYVLCVCDETAPEWSERSARQADLILVVGISGSAPPTKLPEWIATSRNAGARVELAILRNSDVKPRETSKWLDNQLFQAHHHLIVDRSADYARLIRLFSGKAWGLVLGGGGARGLAHIGAIRALLESGIPIDGIAGTSMGAILAAQYAMGAGPDEMIDLTRRTYVGGSSWADLTLPLVSLRSGRRTFAQLKGLFGDTRIEDLPLRYFCVSTNLTRAEAVIHESGPVAMWARVSCSVPGLLPPVPWQGDLLVDGGLLNNLPVAEMRTRMRGNVAASDVSLPVDLQVEKSLNAETFWSGRSQLLKTITHESRLPNIANLLMRMAEISSVRDSKIAGSPADLYLKLPVDGYSMTDFHAIDRLVELGYEYTMRRTRELKLANA